MTTKEIVLNAITNINQDLKIEGLVCIDENTRLFELLDSLGTLDLILELESLLENETGKYIAIANEYSMDKELTPFKTIISLESYVQERIKDA
jgi:acyl carrier protein